MKNNWVTLSRWIKSLGVATIILGVIHCAMTPVIYRMGFDRLSPSDGRAFIFIFASTGVAVIFAGLALIYSSSALSPKTAWAQTIAAGSGVFLALLGIGAVFSMPDNPFAYIALLIAILVLVPLAANRKTRVSRIREVALPVPSLIAGTFPRIDYADAYCMPLPSDNSYTVEGVTHAVFTISLPWIDALMALRDVIVRPLGFKTATAQPERSTVEVGTRVDLFEVLAKTPQEVLMGEDDRHLDFRVSVWLDGPANQQRATVSTIVRYNNWLGRAYFVPVKYFHRLIVPAVMESAARKMQEASGQLAAQPNIP